MLTLVRRGARWLPIGTLPSLSSSSHSLGILLPYHVHENLTEDSVNSHSVASTSAPNVVTSSSPSSVNSSAPFLEEISEEYGYSDRAILTRRYNSSLLNAVRLGDLAGAERIQGALVESGLPITPSSEYAAVALCILRRLSDPDASVEVEVVIPGRKSTFDLAAMWWDLIPSARSAMPLNDSVVREFCSTLESPGTCVAHARRGALILASKGYIKSLKAIIPRIVRFSIPAHSQQFIESVNACDIEHYGTGNNSKWGAGHAAIASAPRVDTAPVHRSVSLDGNTRRRIARRWALAIRTHALAGRPDTAAQLLLHVLKSFPKEIGVFTYFISLKGIHNIHGGSLERENYAAEIRCTAEKNLTSRQLRILDRLLAQSFTSPRQQLSRDNSAIYRGWEGTDRPMLHNLRSLRTASNPLPRVRTLAMWMKACKDGGRKNFMRLLIRRWSRLARRSGHNDRLLPHTYASERLFGAAEMYVALSERKPLEVIKAYMAYFSLEGVPGRRFIDRIARAAPSMSTVGDGSRLSPLLGFDALQGRVSRLTPSLHVIAILIHALLLPIGPHFSRRLRKRLPIDDKKKAVELYDDVLAMFASRAPPSEPGGASYSASYSSGDIPPSFLPDSVIFQAFLSSPHFQTENELASIIADMKRLGVQPSRNNWTTVIGVLSKNGNEQVVLGFLASMERGSLFQKDREGLMPSPDAVTYVTAIQGALVNGHVGLAERVFEIFKTWRVTNNGDWGATPEKTRQVVEHLEQKLVDAKRKIRTGLIKQSKWRVQ